MIHVILLKINNNDFLLAWPDVKPPHREVWIYLYAYNDSHIAYILHYFLFEINNNNCETHYFISVSRMPFENKARVPQQSL